MFHVDSTNVSSRNVNLHRNLRDMMMLREQEQEPRHLPSNPTQRVPVSIQVLDPRLHVRPLRLPYLPTLNEKHRVDVRREFLPKTPVSHETNTQKPRG